MTSFTTMHNDYLDPDKEYGNDNSEDIVERIFAHLNNVDGVNVEDDKWDDFAIAILKEVTNAYETAYRIGAADMVMAIEEQRAKTEDRGRGP